ncbi:DUF6884 domain-containing protein [Streptomyces tsukubensis]|uniref:DUF6884 domain-containing protein n=1 Tax=Streptomyces tsukubensis TaxID=83656 RepID=UPI00344F6063
MTGYHALVKGVTVTVYGPDNAEIASAERRGYNDVLVGRVGDTRLVSDGLGDGRLRMFAVLAARHHRAVCDPDARDRVWVRWEADGVAAVYGTDKYDDDDRRAAKAGNLYWSGPRQGWATGRKWNPGTRDRNLAAVLLAFARQDRNIVVLRPGRTPEDLPSSPAATAPAPQTPAPAAPPVTTPEPEPQPEREPEDFTGLSYEDLVAAEDAAAAERSRSYTTAMEDRYRALREERGRRQLDRVATSTPVTELSDEDLDAENEWWKTAIHKTPFHSSEEEYRTLEARYKAAKVERCARTARTLLAGPAVADLDDDAVESAYKEIGPVWTGLPRGHEVHDQVADRRKALQEERIARRARSYGERTPVGEMPLEDLIAESVDLRSDLKALNEQSAYSHSEAVKEARAQRLRAVEAEWDGRCLEQHPDAARAALGSEIGGRRQVLIDGSALSYGYMVRRGEKFRALASYDDRSSIGDFDSGPAALAALVQRYDQDPKTLPRRTWGPEQQVMLPVSAHDPLVSWLRRRPGEVSREVERVREILTAYQLPTQTKVMNPLTRQVMRAYPFSFEEGLLGELARIAERTAEDLREQSLNEELPKPEREAAKRRIPAMGAALIGMNAVIERVRAAGGDVDRRGVDQGRLAAQMAALDSTVDEHEEGESDGGEQPVRDAAAAALGGVPSTGAGGDAGPGRVPAEAGGADGRGDRPGGGGPGGGAGAGDGVPGPGGAAGADQGDGAGEGAARDAAAVGGRGGPGGAAEPGRGGTGGDPQGAGEPVERFRPDPSDLPRGPLARAEANLAAVTLLRALKEERRGATADEKRVLYRWSGWGSVPTVFLDEPDAEEPVYQPGGEREGQFETDHARWESYSRVRGELRKLLNPFEWRAASRAVLSAHYTPQALAEAMWQGLAAFGFDGGEVLEGGCGSGAFFGVAPSAARLTGVEVDPITAEIAAMIYPHATVLAESFAETDAPLGTFDAVIGNVPFSQSPFGDRRFGTDYNLHNGFIVKKLALLRPGAYMTVITSRWTMDGDKSTPARRTMAQWGDLAAAYRLPRGTFGQTGDTDVVADVLVFRRRAEGEEPGDQSWVETEERDLDGSTLAVNPYFTEHPGHVLGRMTSEAGPYGPRVTVLGDPDAAPGLLRERMEATAAAAVADGLGYVPHEDWPHREPLLLQTARVKHATDFTGRLYTDDQDQIWQHVNGADPVRVVTADGVRGTEQLRALLSMRDVAGELRELDRTGGDLVQAREVRGQLARLHDAYTAAYGPLSRPRQTRTALPTDEARATARAAGVVLDDEDRLPTGWGWFRQDPHAGGVLGLEHWDRANDRAVPSEILARRPGARRGNLERTGDPKTALTAVMGATGRVDLPLIASLLGTTPEEARRQLGTEVFDNPVTRKLEHAGAYLSGAVREKLEQAREAAATDPAYAVNVAALDAVQPKPKRLGQFTAQLGAHWIPAPLVQGFLREYLGDPTLQISHNERYGWSLAAGKVPDSVNALKGTERRTAVHIAKALLGRASMVVNELGGDGNGVDEDATRAMRYKADAMRSAFEEYCTATTARVTQLTDAYNRQMNGHVVRSYDALAPTLEGFTTERTPHPWQLSGAARMQFERGVILAHEMGLGKTTTMVMGSQALKASGQISKPFVVVQPGLGRQWLDEAKLLYRNADIRLITSEDLEGDNRRPVLEWLRSNTPDLVIFTEGAFQSIRMSPEQQELYVFRELESLKEQLERERGVPHNAFALMKLEQRLATVESRIRRNAAPMRTPGEVYWDDLGFDYACIDEAHRFTAVGFRSKEAGGETASVRAVDMHQKLSWHHRMAEYDGGRPTVALGTATPMENSIFEQYACLELAAPWLLDQFGVHGPDLWSETFGQRVQRIEMAPDGSGLTIVERFSRFVSKSTMKTMWALATDTKTGDDVGIERPKLAGGAPELVLVEPTADQRARLQSLVVRGQAIHAGDVTRDEDNMLAVSGEGRAVALDPRLVDAKAPAANKLATAANIIAAGYHAHKDHTYAVSTRDDTPHPVPGGLFFVFCNSGTPGGDNKGGFDAYAELRDLLAARGVPRDMVQFAQQHRTPEQKAAMTEAANNGGIAVLMGSSEVLGTGFNGQNRAYALMHLDQDWTPAMMMQRNGRVIRPGNQHDEVSIYFLATKGSMDGWQVGLLTSKAEGLRDVQRPPGDGDDDNDTVEEIGASDWDWATMAAEISGNPYMQQFMDAKIHLRELEADRRNAAADRVRQTELLGLKEGELAGTRLAIEARDKALPKITDTIRGSDFRIRIDGREYEKFGEAAPVLRQAVTDAVRAHQNEGRGAWKKLGTFGGLDFAVQPEILYGSGEIRAHIGFPELRHSESWCSVEDLVKTNAGATMLGRLATALEKAGDHQLMDHERLPGLEREVADLTAQQEAVNYGPAIEHARQRLELLDAIVGAITELDKTPELTESMLDPAKYPTENRRKKALQENTEKRAPYEANVDAAARRLAAFDTENPAPQLVNTSTEDNDTDEAFEQRREQQRALVRQSREARLGTPVPEDEPAPAPDAAVAAAKPTSSPGGRTAGPGEDLWNGVPGIVAGPGVVKPGMHVEYLPPFRPGARTRHPHGGLIVSVGSSNVRWRPYKWDQDVRTPLEHMRIDPSPHLNQREDVRRMKAALNAGKPLPRHQAWVTWSLAEHLAHAGQAPEAPTGPLVIVPCGSAKLNRKAPAGELYVGPYHRSCREAADALTADGGTVLILSALYGLVTLDQEIEPYDVQMGQLGSVAVEKLREQARELGVDGAREVVVLAGEKYTAAALEVWPDASTPLAGLGGMGYQRQYLAMLAERAPGEPLPQPAAGRDEAADPAVPDGDGYGTVDLFDAFDIAQPVRVPAPRQDDPAPDTEKDETGISDGQMTTDEVPPDAAPADRGTAARDDGRVRLTSADGRLTFTLLEVPADAGFAPEAVEGYRRRHSEFTAVVEAANAQAVQSPEARAEQLARWRRTYKGATGVEPFRPLPSPRLTPRTGTPGLTPAEYGIGSWVTWRDGPDGQEVTGQVMAPGAAGDTWFVSTDRTGHTGEYHVLSRSGKKATGYAYALNGAAVDLRPADGPGVQQPLGDLPEVDSVPARPVTPYTDWLPPAGSALAPVREPIPVTAGEMGPRFNPAEVAFDVTADGIPFVVRLSQNDETLTLTYVPRVESDGVVVAEFGPLDSRAAAVEFCVQVAREARKGADKPLYAKYRNHTLDLAGDGFCRQCSLHLDDATEKRLYRVDGGDPECVSHIGLRLGVSADEVAELARARRIWAARVAPEPGPADAAPPTGAGQGPKVPAALTEQEKAPAVENGEPHEVDRRALRGGDRITVVVSGRSVEWDGEAWGLPVPDTVTVTGTVYPGYRDYRQNTTLLDAVIRGQTGKEVSTPQVFVRLLPERVQIVPAEHREDLRPEARTVGQMRVGDLIADGGSRGEIVTELRFVQGGRRGSMITFTTRDAAAFSVNSFTLAISEEVAVVPRERRLPEDVAALFRDHGSHDKAVSEVQRAFDLNAAVTASTGSVWPNGAGPQDEIRALEAAIGAISPAGRGVDAYRANAAAMEAAAAAAAALFAATDDDFLSRYVGVPLHRLYLHLDDQAQRLHADVATLTERAAAAAAAKPGTADQPALPAPEQQGAPDQPAERTSEGEDVASQSETEQLGLFGGLEQQGPTEAETATGSRAEDGRGAQLRAALMEGETIAPVSFTDRREPAAGWILTTTGGHTFRLRPVPYAPAGEDQWEAGHDADGSYWWNVYPEDRPLAAALTRIREDSTTRTRFATLWASYGHLAARTPQFETTTDRVRLEEGVYLVHRFGSIGLIASCRWGWLHLTDPDGAQGRTGEKWSRKGPDTRQYVAEWKVWHSAQSAIPNARLRVVAQLTDSMADTPDAYCDASSPYVGKCTAKRSGARYTVAVVTDQDSELGHYTVCARCLSHRLLNDEDGIGHHGIQQLAQNLAKGDPKVSALHWNLWPDRTAELAGQMLSAALDAGETAPWPAQALADRILAEACEAGDDRAMREARAEVKAAGGNTKAQKRAADEAFAARQDRAALVALHQTLQLAGSAVEEGSNAVPEPAEEAPVTVNVDSPGETAEAPAAAELRELDVVLLNVDVPPPSPAEPYDTDEEAQADIDRLSEAFAQWGALPTIQRYYDADRQQRADGTGTPTNPVAQLAMAYRDAEQALRDGPAGSPDDLVRQVHTVAVWSGALEPVVDEELRGPLGEVREAAALLASRSQATVEAFEAELAALSKNPAEESPAAKTAPAEQAPVTVDDEPEAPEGTTEPAPGEPAADIGPAEPPPAGQTTAAPATDGALDDDPAPDPREAPEPPAATASPETTAADSGPEQDHAPDPGEPAVAVPDEGMHEARREALFLEQDRPQPTDGGQQMPEPDQDPIPASEDAPGDETARDASEEQTMTTPIPETTDAPPPSEPVGEEPPAPRRYSDTVPLAGDPGYRVRLSGLDGQPVDSGDVRRGDLVIATIHPGPKGGWFARLDAEGLPNDVTYLAEAPQDAASSAATLYSAFTGTPYGPPPGAAVGDETRQRVDVLRADLRDTAVRHRDAVTGAAARAYPGFEQNEHFRALVGNLDGLAAAVSDAHGSQQMTQYLDGIQEAVNAWGGALPDDPGQPERRQLAFPLAHLLYDSRRMRDRVQATLTAVQAEREAARAEEAAAAAALNEGYLADYRAGRPPRDEAAAAAYREWQQPDAEDRQEALEAPGLEDGHRSADADEGTAPATDDGGPQQEDTESQSPEVPDSQSTGTARGEAPAAPAGTTAKAPESAEGAAAPEDGGPAPDTAAVAVHQAPEGAVRAAGQPGPAAPEPGELPLWTAPEASPADTAAAEPPAGPMDIRAEFQAVLDAWDEHVPSVNGTAQDLVADLDADLDALQRAFAEAVTPAPAPADSTAIGGTAGPLPQQAAAVNTALQQADTHAAALQDLPEWQRIQTVRGAVGHLVRVMKERAGQHFDRLFGDNRVGEFFRKLSISACDRVAGWAQAASGHLRRLGEGRESNAAAADALRDVADAATAYSTPGGERGGPPPASSWEAGSPVNVPEMRKVGEALARPMPGAKDGRGPGVSTAAARGKSTTRRGAKKKGGGSAEQAGHLRRGGSEPQQNRKPTQR